jgi:acyl dehydratase
MSEITDAGIEALRARIGKPMRHLYREALVTQDWIDRFALGIGDINPLWTDPIYARETPAGVTTAPPTMVFALCGWDIGTGLPGVHGLYTGCEIEWERPIPVGSDVRSEGHLCTVEEKHGAFAGRMVLQGTETVFRDTDGATLATARNFNLRTSRRAGRESREKGSTPDLEHPTYTPEALERIEIEALHAEIRGDLPRTVGEVGIGQSLVPVVKGPLTATDVVGWMRTGFGGVREGFFMYTHELATIWRRRHPAAVMETPWGYVDSPEAVHWDDHLARATGAPAAFDIGPQRISWMTQVVTNWMGDGGTLKRIAVRLGRFVAMGDTVWCRGEVTATAEDGTVELSLVAENQRGETVGTATATVVLPRTAAGEAA